jgi:hypothetical protein
MLLFQHSVEQHGLEVYFFFFFRVDVLSYKLHLKVKK